MKNVWLLCLILVYLIPIGMVAYHYNQHYSVLSIVCSKELRVFILISMILMGVFTLLYERERGDLVSGILILLLLMSLWIMVCIEEASWWHSVFALLVFICIFGFMVRHTDRGWLWIFPILQGVFFVSLLLRLQRGQDIFFDEVALIANFAIFYLVVHFRT